MKILLSILLSLLIPNALLGQTVAIANDKMNVAYAGIPNPITIAVENYKSEQVIVETDNGTLVSKGSGKYDYTPAKEGTAVLKVAVKTKSGTKAIGQSVYRIKNVPRPFAYVYQISRGQLYIYNPKEVRARLDNFDFDISFEIIDFKIDIYRDKKKIFSGLNKGSKFIGNVATGIGQMKPTDRMHIYEIHCIGPDKKILLLNEINEGYK